MSARVQPAEVVWFLIGLLGMYRGGRALRRAVRDMTRLRRERRPEGERIIGWLYVGVAGPLVGIHLVTMLTGIAAMLILPPPSAPGATVTPTQVAIVVGLFAINALANFASYWLDSSRERLNRYLDRLPPYRQAQVRGVIDDD